MPTINDPHRGSRAGARIHPPLLLLLLVPLFFLSYLGFAVPAAMADEADPPPPPAALISSIAYRDAFLPPGVPSVALRDDETGMLWNPACMAMSRTFHLGYSWKGTYLDDDRKVSNHFFLTKAKGFALGTVREYIGAEKNTGYLFSVFPQVTPRFALGWTGKWKGGFNFDCGAIALIGKRISVGVVGRNLRNKDNVRRYYEGGIAVSVIPRRLGLFFDVIDEDSPWRDETAYGGGFEATLEYGIQMTLSYFNDGERHETVRAGLTLMFPKQAVTGEYTQSTDEWTTLSGRIATHSP